MPNKTPRTKPEKAAAMKTVMGEFKSGNLHSGSKEGPVVQNPAQAKAIAMSESGQASSEAGRNPPPSTYQTHENREKEVMGAGYPAHEAAEKRSWGGGESHKFKEASQSHGYGHNIGQRSGHLRTSGHSGAHRIGRK